MDPQIQNNANKGCDDIERDIINFTKKKKRDIIKIDLHVQNNADKIKAAMKWRVTLSNGPTNLK